MQRVPSCAYCFKPYAFKGSGRPIGQRIPRLLTCGHTFCDGCITKLAELHPRELPCPTCERKTPLPCGKKQIKELPTNLYILGILINNVRAALEKDVTKGELSDFDLEKSLNLIPHEASQTDTSEEAICEECCTAPAVSECCKCEAIFCKPCFSTVHSSSRTLRSHEAAALSKRRLSSIAADDGCSSHDGKELEFYDKTDEKLICALCVVSPACQEHEMVPVDEVCGSIQEKIKQKLEDVKKVHSKLQQSRGKLSRLFPEIKAECGESIQQIKENFQDLHTKLQAREVELIQEVKTAYCSESFLVNTANEIVQQSKELATVIEQSTVALSSPSLLMRKEEELMSKLDTSKETPCILLQSSIHDLIRVSYSDEFNNNLKSCGSVVVNSGGLLLKRLSEVPGDIDLDEDDKSTIGTSEVEDSEDSVAGVTSMRPGRATMSLSPRQNLVYITHIKNPCDFMVQHAADEERLENLMEAVNRYCVGAKSLNDVVKSTQVGDMVCAQYSKDQYWYRARIIGQQQRPSALKSHVQPLPQVEVCFIDYGNTEVVPLNRLRKIRPEFTDIPELATNCSLVDIVPPMQNETWPMQSIKAFGSLTREKALLMSVMKRSGGKLFVDLRSPDEEPTQDDDKPASVRDALVFLDVARFKTSASVANRTASYPVRSFKEVPMPEEGETVEVVVTHSENPGVVYIMKDTGKEYADTMKIINQMSVMYSTKKGNQWKILWPYKGLVCAARFSGDQVWYRALVTDVVTDQLVRVTYVDFGNSEELPFSQIRRIPDHMVQLPMQAIQCCLSAVKPINQEIGWSNDCNAFLSDTCILQRYRMKVVESKKGQPLSVILYETDIHQGTSVNRLLLLNMHAAVSDPAMLEILQSDTTKDSEEITSVSDTCEIHNTSIGADEMEQNMPVENVQGKQLLFPKKLMYKPVELPSKTKLGLAVSYVDEDCIISGYQSENGDKSLPELMKHVQTICTAPSEIPVSQDQLSFNQPCCAKFSEDNLWYRAEVIDFPSPSTVLVDYVDFGNKEEIPLTSIKLNAAFLEIPKQCLPVQLEGIPCEFDDKVMVSKYLAHLLVGQMCVATIKKSSLKQDMVKCIQLTLPDGTDVIDLIKDKILKEDDLIKDKILKEDGKDVSQKHKSVGPVLPKVGPIRSLIPNTVLPDEGVAFDVTVTQVDMPNIVFLQRTPPTEDDPGYADRNDPTIHVANEHLIMLEDISDKINSPDYFEGKADVKNVWEQMLCCGRYTQDDLWYRAQIQAIESTDPLEVRVLFIDYGTSEVIGLDRLKPFPAELLALPKQAFHCSIAGLPSSTNKDSGADNTAQAVNMMINAVAGKKLICRVLNFNSPIIVELFERVFSEDSYEDVPLPQRLAELELMIHMNALDFYGAAATTNDEEEPSKTEDDEEPEEEFVLQKTAEDDDSEEEFVSRRRPRDKHEKEDVSDEELIERPRQDIPFQRPQLLTPAQFCLKKDAVVVPPPKNIPTKSDTADKENDTEDVLN